MYLSLLTITTLGYTEIMPKSFLAQLAVSLEVVFGIAWTLVVFAALLIGAEVRARTASVQLEPVHGAHDLDALRTEIRELRRP